MCVREEGVVVWLQKMVGMFNAMEKFVPVILARLCIRVLRSWQFSRLLVVYYQYSSALSYISLPSSFIMAVTLAVVCDIHELLGLYCLSLPLRRCLCASFLFLCTEILHCTWLLAVPITSGCIPCNATTSCSLLYCIVHGKMLF